MSNKYQAMPCDISELAFRMRTSKNKDAFRRFQVIWLRASKGFSVKEISSATCYSVSWVRQLHSLYRQGALTPLLCQKKGVAATRICPRLKKMLLLSHF